MSSEAQIDAALEAIVSAARHHRAVLQAGASEERVWRAYVALNNATVRYDDLISTVYDEVTPWDCEYLEADGDPDRQPEVASSDVGRADTVSGVGSPGSGASSLMVCVRHRRDYVVPEPARLLTLATEARRTSWAGIDATHAARPVTQLGEAVNELLQAGDGTVAALDAYPEELIPGNGVLLVNELHRPLMFADPALPGVDEPSLLSTEPSLLSSEPLLLGADPLLLGADEVQLYRMDEEVVDEDVVENERVDHAGPSQRGTGVSDPTRPVDVW